MRPRASELFERPFPRYPNKTHYKVQYLEDGNWGDGRIEVSGDEVPEYLGPDEAFDGAGYLIWFNSVSRV